MSYWNVTNLFLRRGFWSETAKRFTLESLCRVAHRAGRCSSFRPGLFDTWRGLWIFFNQDVLFDRRRWGSLTVKEQSEPFICRVHCHGRTECYNCMCGARRRAGGVRVLLLFLVTCIVTAWCNARNVHVMRHLADSRYSNLWDGVISKAWLNILEGVWKNWKSWDQSWGCLYKAWSCSRSREEPAEIRERENIGERQKKKRGVLSTSLCRQLWLCHRHLGSSWSCSLLYQDLL